MRQQTTLIASLFSRMGTSPSIERHVRFYWSTEEAYHYHKICSETYRNIKEPTASLRNGNGST